MRVQRSFSTCQAPYSPQHGWLQGEGTLPLQKGDCHLESPLNKRLSDPFLHFMLSNRKLPPTPLVSSSPNCVGESTSSPHSSPLWHPKSAQLSTQSRRMSDTVRMNSTSKTRHRPRRTASSVSALSPTKQRPPTWQGFEVRALGGPPQESTPLRTKSVDTQTQTSTGSDSLAPHVQIISVNSSGGGSCIPVVSEPSSGCVNSSGGYANYPPDQTSSRRHGMPQDRTAPLRFGSVLEMKSSSKKLLNGGSSSFRPRSPRPNLDMRRRSTFNAPIRPRRVKSQSRCKAIAPDQLYLPSHHHRNSLMRSTSCTASLSVSGNEILVSDERFPRHKVIRSSSIARTRKLPTTVFTKSPNRRASAPLQGIQRHQSAIEKRDMIEDWVKDCDVSNFAPIHGCGESTDVLCKDGRRYSLTSASQASSAHLLEGRPKKGRTKSSKARSHRSYSYQEVVEAVNPQLLSSCLGSDEANGARHWYRYREALGGRQSLSIGSLLNCLESSSDLRLCSSVDSVLRAQGGLELCSSTDSAVRCSDSACPSTESGCLYWKEDAQSVVRSGSTDSGVRDSASTDFEMHPPSCYNEVGGEPMGVRPSGPAVLHGTHPSEGQDCAPEHFLQHPTTHEPLPPLSASCRLSMPPPCSGPPTEGPPPLVPPASPPKDARAPQVLPRAEKTGAGGLAKEVLLLLLKCKYAGSDK